MLTTKDIFELAGLATVVIILVGWICGLWLSDETCQMCGGLGERAVDSEFNGVHMMKCPLCLGTGHRSGK